MAKQFIYAPINPLRLTQLTVFDPRYNYLPFDFQEPSLPYSQKYQTNDTVKIQCLSDWVPTLYIKNILTNKTVEIINPTTPVTSILGQTYTCYEFEIIWATVGESNYYAEITYTDDTPTLQLWQSEPIQIQASWPNTILFEYLNSVNLFSAAFATGIVFNLRVEGAATKDYNPEFEDVIYTDQSANTTKLNAVPKRSFTLYVPGENFASGIPNWMGDKINWVFGCDQIKIDGQYYQNTSGSKWEVKRTDPDGTEFIGLKLSIVEVNNLFLQALKTGIAPPQGFTVVELSIINSNQSANFSIPGKFKKFSLIKNITANNYGSAFTLTVGITPGGNEIGIFKIPVPDANFAFNESVHLALLSPQTLYFSGLTGQNADICIDYMQYDAPSSSPGAAADPGAFPANFVGMWEALADTDFNRDWDISTGLGKVDTNYYGCAICDGRNNTVNRGGTVAIGFAVSTNVNYIGVTSWMVSENGYTGYDQLATPSVTPAMVGTASNRQTMQQLAPHSHSINTANSSTSGPLETDPVRSKIQGTRSGNRGGGGTPGTAGGQGGDGITDNQTIGIVGGNGDNTGLGAPDDNRQLSVVTLYFKKIR